MKILLGILLTAVTVNFALAVNNKSLTRPCIFYLVILLMLSCIPFVPTDIITTTSVPTYIYAERTALSAVFSGTSMKLLIAFIIGAGGLFILLYLLGKAVEWSNKDNEKGIWKERFKGWK